MNFSERIQHAVETLGLPRGQWEATVSHDDDCRMVAGRGICTCCPDIMLEAERGLWSIGRDGTPNMQRGRS